MGRLKWWNRNTLVWDYVPVGTATPEQAVWHGAGAAVVGVSEAGYALLGDGYLGRVVLTAGTAPTGDDITVDVKVNGTVEQTATLAATSTTQVTTPPLSPTVAVLTGDVITIEITQVGSTEAGQDLTVQVELVEVEPE